MENSSIVSFRVSTRLDTEEDGSFWSRVKMAMRTRRAMAAVSTVFVIVSIVAMWFGGVFSPDQPTNKQDTTSDSGNQAIRWIVRHQKGLLIGVLALMAVVAGSVSLYYINRNGATTESEVEQEEDDKRTVWYGLLFAVLGLLAILMVLVVAQWWRERQWRAKVEKERKPFVLYGPMEPSVRSEENEGRKTRESSRLIWDDSMVVPPDDQSRAPQLDPSLYPKTIPSVPVKSPQTEPLEEEEAPKLTPLDEVSKSAHRDTLVWDDSMVRKPDSQDRVPLSDPSMQPKMMHSHDPSVHKSKLPQVDPLGQDATKGSPTDHSDKLQEHQESAVWDDWSIAPLPDVEKVDRMEVPKNLKLHELPASGSKTSAAQTASEEQKKAAIDVKNSTYKGYAEKSLEKPTFPKAPVGKSIIQDGAPQHDVKKIADVEEKQKDAQSDDIMTVDVLPKLEVDIHKQLKFYLSNHAVKVAKSDLKSVPLNRNVTKSAMTKKLGEDIYEAIESGKTVENVRGILFHAGTEETLQETVHKAEQTILSSLPADCYTSIANMHSCMNAVFTLIPFMVNKRNAEGIFLKNDNVKEVAFQRNIQLFDSMIENIYNVHLLLSEDGTQVVPLNHFVMPPTLEIMHKGVDKKRFEMANLISLLLKTQGQLPSDLLKLVPVKICKSVSASYVVFMAESDELLRYEWTWIIYAAITLIEDNPPSLLKALTISTAIDTTKPLPDLTPITLSEPFPTAMDLPTKFEYNQEMDDWMKRFRGFKTGWFGANKFTLFRHFEKFSAQHYQDLYNFEDHFMKGMEKTISKFTSIYDAELFMRRVQAALTHVTFWEDGKVYSIADSTIHSVDVDQYVDFGELFKEPLLQYIQAAVFTLSGSKTSLTIDPARLTKFHKDTFKSTRKQATRLYFEWQSAALCSSVMCTNLSRVPADRPHRRALHWILYFANVIHKND